MTEILRLMSLASPAKGLPALLAAFFAALSGIALIGAAAWIIASAALAPPLSALTLGITCVRAAGVSRAVFRYLDRLLSHRLAFACYEELQLLTYRQAAGKLPLKEGAMREGEFLHDLLTGCETLRNFYLRTVPPPLLAGLVALFTAAALLPLSALAASLVAALYLLHLALPLLLKEESLREESAAYRDTLLDLIDGRTELHQAGALPQARQMLDDAAKTFQEKQSEKRQKRERLFTLLDVSRVSLWIGLLLLLLPLAQAGEISGIEYAVWALVLEAALAEYRALPAAVLGASAARQAAQNILPSKDEMQPEAATTKEMATRKPPMPALPAADSAAPLLEARNIRFAYQAGLSVLENLTFCIRRGEHTAIIGESGAGKTTLASLLLRLWDIDSGTIFYSGVAHTSLTADAVRSLFGVSLQGSYLFSASVRDNFLRLHEGITEDAMWQSLETAQLADVVRSLPQGLDEPLGENASRLSG
uniref:ATP-binding cassette domain-containing protein n=1 Tax=uncultured Selenomonas sp. TaxID=159275 RepID=UPI002624C53E